MTRLLATSAALAALVTAVPAGAACIDDIARMEARLLTLQPGVEPAAGAVSAEAVEDIGPEDANSDANSGANSGAASDAADAGQVARSSEAADPASEGLRGSGGVEGADNAGAPPASAERGGSAASGSGAEEGGDTEAFRKADSALKQARAANASGDAKACADALGAAAEALGD